jgi:hypothetical protein
MKTIIAVLPSIAFMTSVFAALPSALGGEQSNVRSSHLLH